MLEKPLDIDHLIGVVRQLTCGQSPSKTDETREHLALGFPTCPAERWATYVLKGAHVDGRLNTTTAWARAIGIGYSSLRETCRLLHTPPHDARDLTRVLRAVLLSNQQSCALEALLDVGEQRTLDRLLDRAGLRDRALHDTVTPDQCLRLQRFVPHDHPGLRVLQRLLQARAARG